MKQLIFLLLAFPILVSADPSTATRYLINEPASLMDIGIMRLNADLNGPEMAGVPRVLAEESPSFKYDGLSVNAAYEFDDDKIAVIAAIQTDGQISDAGCKAIIKSLRALLKVIMPLAISHQGYKSRGQPENLYEGLAERTEIRCSIFETSTFKFLYGARGSMNGTDIFVAKPD